MIMESSYQSINRIKGILKYINKILLGFRMKYRY